MNPGIAANQQRLFLAFVATLRPHLHRDSALPRRIKETLARNRAIGSRDRKLYRELIYTYLRFLPWIDPWVDSSPALAAKITAWLAPELKPTSAYRAVLCGDWPATPPTLAEKSTALQKLVASEAHLSAPTGTETTQLRAPLVDPDEFNPQSLLPVWFREHCPAAFEPPHLDAINRRANVWVRIQCQDRDLALAEFRGQRWEFTQPAGFPDAVCLPPNAEVATTDAYRRGFVEIQDFGSQLVLAHATVASGSRWLDACAGAGGKTLQLARLVGPEGRVDATDIRLEILDELRDRAQRARLENISIVAQPSGLYDGVLVDAPCSGSGTWRRQPHLKWYVKAETIGSFAKTQREILTATAPLVRPGGWLVYATCSLSHHENQDVVSAFLEAHPNFEPATPVENLGGVFDGFGTSLLPGSLDTDGFYLSLLRRGAVQKS